MNFFYFFYEKILAPTVQLCATYSALSHPYFRRTTSAPRDEQVMSTPSITPRASAALLMQPLLIKPLRSPYGQMCHPLLCVQFGIPSQAVPSSCNCKWCQRALFGDWARPQQDACCWSQFFWCNKIKVNPWNSLADSFFLSQNWSASLFHPGRGKYKSKSFFLFFNFLT